MSKDKTAPEPKADKNQDQKIYDELNAGAILGEVAEKYELTPEAVEHIVAQINANRK